MPLLLSPWNPSISFFLCDCMSQRPQWDKQGTSLHCWKTIVRIWIAAFVLFFLVFRCHVGSFLMLGKCFTSLYLHDKFDGFQWTFSGWNVWWKRFPYSYMYANDANCELPVCCRCKVWNTHVDIPGMYFAAIWVEVVAKSKSHPRPVTIVKQTVHQINTQGNVSSTPPECFIRYLRCLLAARVNIYMEKSSRGFTLLTLSFT